MLLAFAAGAEITHRGGECGCLDDAGGTGMKIRITKARVKRALTVPAVGSVSGTVGLALPPFFMLIPGIGFYTAWPLGSALFLAAVLRYDRWLQRRKSLLTGPAKPLRKGILRRGRKTRR